MYVRMYIRVELARLARPPCVHVNVTYNLLPTTYYPVLINMVVSTCTITTFLARDDAIVPAVSPHQRLHPDPVYIREQGGRDYIALRDAG